MTPTHRREAVDMAIAHVQWTILERNWQRWHQLIAIKAYWPLVREKADALLDCEYSDTMSSSTIRYLMRLLYEKGVIE